MLTIIIRRSFPHFQQYIKSLHALNIFYSTKFGKFIISKVPYALRYLLIAGNFIAQTSGHTLKKNTFFWDSDFI